MAFMSASIALSVASWALAKAIFARRTGGAFSSSRAASPDMLAAKLLIWTNPNAIENFSNSSSLRPTRA
jgi:hypothetical protein